MQPFFSPKVFYRLFVVYAIIAVIAGFKLAHFGVAFIAVIFFSFCAYIANRYTKPPVPSKNTSGLFLCFIVVAIMLSLLSNPFFNTDLITDKTQLQQITGIVPKESLYKPKVGKYGTSKMFLPLNNQLFHCRESTYDGCHLVYEYTGQNAKVWYQSNSEVGNLVYQIEINGKKVYEFESQLNKFKTYRNERIYEFIWTLLIFILPMLFFSWQSNRIYQTLPKMTTDEEQTANTQYDEELKEYFAPENYLKPSFKRIVIGVIISISLIIGLILIF